MHPNRASQPKDIIELARWRVAQRTGYMYDSAHGIEHTQGSCQFQMNSAVQPDAARQLAVVVAELSKSGLCAFFWRRLGLYMGRIQRRLGPFWSGAACKA